MGVQAPFNFNNPKIVIVFVAGKYYSVSCGFPQVFVMHFLLFSVISGEKNCSGAPKAALNK